MESQETSSALMGAVAYILLPLFPVKKMGRFKGAQHAEGVSDSHVDSRGHISDR